MSNLHTRLKLAASVRLWRRRRNAYGRSIKKVTRMQLTPQRRAAALKRYGGLHTHAVKMLQLRQRQLAAAKSGMVVPAAMVKKTRLPATLGEQAWRVAGQLVGIMEKGENNSGDRVLEIIRANGGTGPEAWCGDFVAYCCRKAGSKCVTRAWAAVRNLGRLTGMKSIPIRTMKKGDIVVYTFDHTGLFGWYCDSNGQKTRAKYATHIATREGNTGRLGAVSDSRTGGDGVYEKIRPIELVMRGVRVLR